MAGRVIRFFPRQAVVGNVSAANSIYSPVFEVVNVDTLFVETRIYSASVATADATVIIQETTDPTLGDDSWTSLGTASHDNGAGATKTTLTNPLRFVRAKLTVTADESMVVAVEAVGRGPS